MGFWIFMFVFDLFVPLSMIGFGHYFKKTAPKEINSTFGYRTAMSMKNRDTWTFAHSFCGKVWWWGGLILAVITIIGMLFVINGSEDTVGIVGVIICYIQLLVLVGSIFPTEIALKKNFDKDGKRKQ